jgi:hypothetical protein
MPDKIIVPSQPVPAHKASRDLGIVAPKPEPRVWQTIAEVTGFIAVSTLAVAVFTWWS